MKEREKHSALFRASSVLLVLLALSPFTAPFSTCDLIDLFGGTARAGGAILQSKTHPDASPVMLSGASGAPPACDQTARSFMSVVVRLSSVGPLHLPLRI